jgi:transposase
MTQVLYVGIDMSKTRFDVALCLEREATTLGQYPNQEKGFEKMAKELSAKSEANDETAVNLIVEPTGGYEKRLVAFAFEQGWRVSLPNPKQVRDWAKGMGVRAKNDPLDSRTLAQFGAIFQPAPENCLVAEVAGLDTLLRRQEDLQQMLREEQNRRQALDYKPHAALAAKESVDRTIEWLEKELEQVEVAIKELLDQHTDLKAQARLLRTVPGIGPKIELIILVFLHRWQARTAGQGSTKGLVAFAGLDPQERRSGDSVFERATISKMGCTFTRHKLYLGAKGGVMARSGPLRHFYDRLRGRGKAYDLALIAAARKILVWAFAIFSRQVPFDPALHSPAST